MLFEVEPILPFAPEPPVKPWGINFGAGTNSWAMVLAAYERGLKPDWILFADTGSETPETYQSVERMHLWATENGWPFEVVRWIRKDGTFESIHDNCLRTGYLPSKAYGLAGCTWKWKVHPMQQWRKNSGFNPTTIAIGYDAGESARLQSAANRYCDNPEVDTLSEVPWYPLVAWGMDRAACHAINEKHGIKVGKSSCFMCPNMRPNEWDWLKQEHPDLYEIAEKIEDGAVAAGNAQSRRLFQGGYRQAGICACFIDEANDEQSACQLPEGSWLTME